MKMLKDLEHVNYAERLRAVTGQPAEEKAQGHLIHVYGFQVEGGKEDRASKEVMGTN